MLSGEQHFTKSRPLPVRSVIARIIDSIDDVPLFENFHPPAQCVRVTRAPGQVGQEGRSEKMLKFILIAVRTSATRGIKMRRQMPVPSLKFLFRFARQRKSDDESQQRYANPEFRVVHRPGKTNEESQIDIPPGDVEPLLENHVDRLPVSGIGSERLESLPADKVFHFDDTVHVFGEHPRGGGLKKRAFRLVQ